AWGVGADVGVGGVAKFVWGHRGVLGGTLVFKEAGPLFDKARTNQREGGAVPSPFECWLTLRGLQTFPYRVRAHSENAQRVADFLSRQPKIEAVHYPGLSSHPGHKIAASQMSTFGDMLSIHVKCDHAEAFNV